MLQWEHSAILLTFIKLPFVINIFILSIFKWHFIYTGFSVVFWIWNLAADILSRWHFQHKNIDRQRVRITWVRASLWVKWDFTGRDLRKLYIWNATTGRGYNLSVLVCSEKLPRVLGELKKRTCNQKDCTLMQTVKLLPDWTKTEPAIKKIIPPLPT